MLKKCSVDEHVQTAWTSPDLLLNRAGIVLQAKLSKPG
jgi:hypothetical protein